MLSLSASCQDDHPPPGPPKLRPSVPETTALPFGAIAKLLNPLLQIFFAPSAKVCVRLALR